jgi:CheY-like chemotaxis protein
VPLKVLLADDSMTAQNMGKKILIDAGYQVIAVSNGAQAMKKLASEKPDLVILDVYMPGYTGLEICERIKSTPESANTPVVLCVAKMEPFKPEEGVRVKADAVIIKPFEATDLVARMQEMQDKLARWRASQAEVDESVSRFEAAEPEPVEEESARERIEVPDEMAAAPAFGMEFETESAPDLSKFTGEFVVEHEREPVNISGSSHMVAADGLSGVFEMQQPAAQKSEVQEFEISAPVAPEAELEVETHDSAETAIEVSVTPDPAIERFDGEQESPAETPSAGETAQGSEFEIVAPAAAKDEIHGDTSADAAPNADGEEVQPDANLSVEVEAAAAGEVEPRSEFVIERISIPVSEAVPEVVGASPLPTEPVTSTVETAEPANASVGPDVDLLRVGTELQPDSSGAVAVAEETTTDFGQALNWVAEEVALDPGEASNSLEEEMRALLAETSEEKQASPEAAPQLEVGEDEFAAPGPPEESTASAEGQVIAAPEPPATNIEQAVTAADIIAADSVHTWPSADSLRCEADPVIEAAPEPTVLNEADSSVPAVPAVEPNPLASAMAAAIVGTLPPTENSAATDADTVEEAVDRLLDRLKPDLVSQILRELNKK